VEEVAVPVDCLSVRAWIANTFSQSAAREIRKMRTFSDCEPCGQPPPASQRDPCMGGSWRGRLTGKRLVSVRRSDARAATAARSRPKESCRSPACTDARGRSQLECPDGPDAPTHHASSTGSLPLRARVAFPTKGDIRAQTRVCDNRAQGRAWNYTRVREDHVGFCDVKPGHCRAGLADGAKQRVDEVAPADTSRAACTRARRTASGHLDGASATPQRVEKDQRTPTI